MRKRKYNRTELSDEEQMVVRTIRVHVFVDTIHEIQPVPGQERKYCIKALLWVFMRVDPIRKVRTFIERALRTAQRFTRDLPLHLRQLILHLSGASVERLSQ